MKKNKSASKSIKKRIDFLERQFERMSQSDFRELQRITMKGGK